MNLEHIVQKNKADRGLRFINLIIDLVVFYSSFIILSFIIGLIAVILGFNI